MTLSQLLLLVNLFNGLKDSEAGCLDGLFCAFDLFGCGFLPETVLVFLAPVLTTGFLEAAALGTCFLEALLANGFRGAFPSLLLPDFTELLLPGFFEVLL